MKKIDNESEYVCNKCHGIGTIDAPESIRPIIRNKKISCNKCLGTGYLDWVENILQKKNPFIYAPYIPHITEFYLIEEKEELNKLARLYGYYKGE